MIPASAAEPEAPAMAAHPQPISESESPESSSSAAANPESSGAKDPSAPAQCRSTSNAPPPPPLPPKDLVESSTNAQTAAPVWPPAPAASVPATQATLPALDNEPVAASLFPEVPSASLVPGASSTISVPAATLPSSGLATSPWMAASASGSTVTPATVAPGAGGPEPRHHPSLFFSPTTRLASDSHRETASVAASSESRYPVPPPRLTHTQLPPGYVQPVMSRRASTWSSISSVGQKFITTIPPGSPVTPGPVLDNTVDRESSNVPFLFPALGQPMVYSQLPREVMPQSQGAGITGRKASTASRVSKLEAHHFSLLEQPDPANSSTSTILHTHDDSCGSLKIDPSSLAPGNLIIYPLVACDDTVMIIEKPDDRLFQRNIPMLLFLFGFFAPPLLWAIGSFWVRYKERHLKVWGYANMTMFTFTAVLSLSIIIWGIAGNWTFQTNIH
ncbi:uncharacterized protein BJ171DRAFT_129044 [Polychytrium aggregatum]|uniref:uncharacterized protein n=1 Tax=Polychytrium aggregatum TaxID=110093 RepID=UPI0022FF2360|nr:uncharacterized protein BJ171DRAFT_129044 [Polychytrium aggregatum]KAI9204122.1 hypothetical protein BJ171DRAFT_129044 [Polychytrium aggregatum]